MADFYALSRGVIRVELRWIAAIRYQGFAIYEVSRVLGSLRRGNSVTTVISHLRLPLREIWDLIGDR